MTGEGGGRLKNECEDFMNKILYTHIMGCAAALTVGAWGENAKADYYTDVNTMKQHWKASEDLFPRVFDDSFQHSDSYTLWSATFPPNFKYDKGGLYRIKKAAEGESYHTFHTADELQALPIDASLKKICKALGSRRFLAEILDETTVNAICDGSIGANRETTVTFEPYYDGETFFDAYGNGRLKMVIDQDQKKGPTDLFCDFGFIFKKEDENVSMIGYDAFYRTRSKDSISFRFYPRPQALPVLFCSSIRESGLRIIDTYRDLCNVLDESGHEDFEKHWAVRINGEEPEKFEVPLFLFGEDGDRAHRADVYTRMLCKILPSEAFLKRIFGEDVWKILEKYNRVNRTISISDFRIDYTIRPLKNGQYWQRHDPDQFEVYLRISDRVFYSNKPSFGHSRVFNVEDFNFIGFRFIFDIEENKIRDVKFCDKLCLNGELITKGETEETTWDLFE